MADETTPTLTLGQQRLRTGFNPSREKSVDRIKQDMATIIDEMKALGDASVDRELQRICAIAMAELETAAMWAVKAATYGK